MGPTSTWTSIQRRHTVDREYSQIQYLYCIDFILGNLYLAGRMKFALLLIGLMLLKGIELHRHKHGHKSDTRQDERIMPKLGTFKNKLVAKYGTTLRYL